MTWLLQRAGSAPIVLNGDDFRLGSHPNCDVVISEAESRHASLRRVAGRWLLKAEPEAPLWINGTQRASGYLTEGDKFKLTGDGPEWAFCQSDVSAAVVESPTPSSVTTPKTATADSTGSVIAPPSFRPSPPEALSGVDSSPIGSDSARDPNQLRVFVSSPGDVREERELTNRVISRVGDRYAAAVHLERVFWELEPLVATATFQKQIATPADCDIVVCILWSRLGTPLPETFKRVDGTRYQSGTELEFEAAFFASQRHGKPDLLVYHKTATPTYSDKSIEAIRSALDQRERLDQFMRKWFFNEDGTLSGAFHQFELPAAFEEKLEQHLMKLVERHIKRLGLDPKQAVEKQRITWTHGSPYRGLESFDFEHEPIFFGRTRAVSAVLQLTQQQAAAKRPFLLILGQSGSGKSSLVRAGVLPMLTRDGVIPGVVAWRRAIVRLSEAPDNPWRALASALLSSTAFPDLVTENNPLASLTKMLETNRAKVLELLQQRLAKLAADKPAVPARDEATKPTPVAKLVVFLDQLEEFFTLVSADKSEVAVRHEFALFLEEAVQTQSIWMLTTLRADFYPQLSECPPLVRLKEGNGQYDLPPLTKAEIQAVINQPAIASGLRFERSQKKNERVDELLCDAAVASPASLPLLEFTLDELYKRRSDKNVLTLKAYHELDGLEGALATKANEVFRSLRPEVRDTLTFVFRQLVTVDEANDAKSARRPASLDALRATAQSAEFVDAFIQARLFCARQSADGTPSAEITHEALLSRWKPLRVWVEANRDLLRIQSRVSTAAKRWDEAGRPRDLLLATGRPLDEAQTLVVTGMSLSKREEDFLNKSRGKAALQRSLRLAGLAVLLTLTLMFGGTALFAISQMRAAQLAKQKADEQKQKADEQTRIAQNNANAARNAEAAARDALAAAKLNEQAARRAEKDALQAVAKVTRAAEALKSVPGSESVQKELLALSANSESSLKPSDDIRTRAERNRQAVALGEVMSEVDDVSKSADQLQAAITEADAISGAEPKNVEFEFNAAFARLKYGEHLWGRGDYAKAAELLRDVVKRFEALNAKNPQEKQYRYHLALGLMALANASRLDEAEPFYQRSRSFIEPLQKDEPRNSDYRVCLSRVLHNLGRHASTKLNSVEARDLFLLARDHLKSGLLVNPKDPRLQNRLCVTLAELAVTQQRLKENDAAQASFKECLVAGQELTANSPLNARYQWIQAYGVRKYADFLSSVNRYKEAEEQFKLCCQINANTVRFAPDRPPYAVDLLGDYRALASFYGGGKEGHAASDAEKQLKRSTLMEAVSRGKEMSTRFGHHVPAWWELILVLVELSNVDSDATPADPIADAKSLPLLEEAIAIFEREIIPFPKEAGDYLPEFVGHVGTAYDCATRLKKTDVANRFIELGLRVGQGVKTTSGVEAYTRLLNIQAENWQQKGDKQKALARYEEALKHSRPVLAANAWHYYLRNKVMSAALNGGKIALELKNHSKAVELFRIFMEEWGEPYQGLDRDKDTQPKNAATESEARRLKGLIEGSSRLTRFTIPTDFSGIKYPFHVYISNVKWPKDPLEDQATWLEKERGGKIPEDVRDSFRRLHKIAYENKVSLQDLCIYALGTAAAEEGKKVVIEEEKSTKPTTTTPAKPATTKPATTKPATTKPATTKE